MEAVSETPLTAHDPADAAPPRETPASTTGSKNHTTIGGVIRGLFRDAIKAVTCPNPKPKPKRRTGETDKGFVAVCRTMLHRLAKTGAAARGRYAALQPAPKAQASAARENTISIPAEFFYADPADCVFDIANPLYDHGDSFDDSSDFYSAFDTEQNYLSPHL
jgi:hypothetical protein